MRYLRNALGLTVLALMGAIAFAPAMFGQDEGRNIVTCEDGTRLLATPFNPTPCAKIEPIDPTAGIPDDFLLVFGPPPEPTQRSFEDRIARMRYRQELRHFRGLIEPPEEYFQKPRLQPTASRTLAEYYSSWGLGEPVFYADRYGEYVRWPDSLYGPYRSAVTTSLLAPGLVVARWHVRAIQGGYCVFDVQAFVPGELHKRNAENCDAAEAESSNQPDLDLTPN